MTPRRSAYTPEEFVAIWQSAKTIDDVVKATKDTRRNLSLRAWRYRKLGVKLKFFQNNKPLEIKELNRVAKRSYRR